MQDLEPKSNGEQPRWEEPGVLEAVAAGVPPKTCELPSTSNLSSTPTTTRSLLTPESSTSLPPTPYETVESLDSSLSLQESAYVWPSPKSDEVHTLTFTVEVTTSERAESWEKITKRLQRQLDLMFDQVFIHLRP